MIKVYGYSDDTIIVNVNGDQLYEVGVHESPRYLHFDTGHILKACYSDRGIWDIDEIRGGSGHCGISRCGGRDEDSFTDNATISDANEWCATYAVDGPTSDDIALWWDGLDEQESNDILYRAYSNAHSFLAASTGHKVEGGGE